MWKKLLLILFILSVRANASTVTLVSSDWPPYTGPNLKNNGFTAEIIKQALAYSGITSHFIYMPWKRAMESARAGEVDALYSAYYSYERAASYLLTEPYISSELMFAVHKDSALSGYNELADLVQYRIGVVRGYVNNQEFDQADYLNKEEVTNDQLNLKKLMGRRVDLIVIDKYVALHLLSSMNYPENSIRFLDKPLDMKPVYVMFSRENIQSPARVEAFNRGLQAIKAAGIYQKILKMYGFSVQPEAVDNH
ncbi:substrate-binding periplasmic protein [Oceanospirillum sediminis]|uniref:Amino acid ABC transporter substrate-binding protein n=1 Tax=Oceanospirillum sediminis TaxID=2760088 RepID=A0A839ITM1_9GAMM|nr:transporter substrate-binding domain-containing protein [Oceanospirillum sediminis]MBB1488030.1 amino acid ABC transporter substrate-binding protein [Oceanospirillum sediminis]